MSDIRKYGVSVAGQCTPGKAACNPCAAKGIMMSVTGHRNLIQRPGVAGS